MRLAREAAAQGAKYIAGPEFMATGYCFMPQIWQATEPANGPSVTLLENLTREEKVWLSAGFLEVKDRYFLNAYAVIRPDGEEDGRVYKQYVASFDGAFTKGVPGNHYIDIDLGRIDIGICYDN